MAASTVSRLESGARRIALHHLPPLARALDVTVDALLEPAGAAPIHGFAVRRSRAPGSPSFRSAAPGPRPVCGHSRSTIPPSTPTCTLEVDDGHDWLYVLSGRLRLVLGEEDFVLEPGEAVEFSCRTPHWLGAIGGPAEALAVFGPHGERLHTR